MKTIQITLPQTDYSYSVAIGSEIIGESLWELLKGDTQSSLFVVTNTTVNELYPEVPELFLPQTLAVKKLVLPDGENHKHLETISTILDFLAEKGANRSSILIAFGGGVIGDMAGFAAAVFMRGIRYIQIPTTLLSQVDSGIGGKTGVNHPLGKNMIGAFKQPLKTIIDIGMLKTLPRREFVAGYAELIKHGLIRNRNLFDCLKDRKVDELIGDSRLLTHVMQLSCQIKADVVEQDEKETGLRAILNFGHTIGHFLETVTEYKAMLHGEAVIVGMDFAAWWSRDKGVLSEPDYQAIHRHLKQLNVSPEIKPVSRETFITIVTHDKKSAAEGIRFIGLDGIGSAVIFENTTAESLWEKYQSFLQDDTFLRHMNP